MNSLKKILSYTKKYWKYLGISIIAATLFGAFSAAPMWFIQNTVDDVLVKKLENLLIPFIAIFILLFVLKGVFMYLSNYYMNLVGNKVVNDIRKDLFVKVVHFPISFFQKNTTGQLMSHFLNDIQMVQNASSSAIKNGVRSFFEAIGLLGVAFYQSWKLAFLMIFVGPAIGISISKMGKAVKAASILIQKSIGNISSILQEVFVGIREVKAFNGETAEIKRFSWHLNECLTSIMRNVHIESLGPAFIEAIAMFGIGFIFYIAGKQIMNGTMSAGQVTSFFGSMLLAYQPLKRLITVYSEVQYGLAAADRIFELMDRVYVGAHSKFVNSYEHQKINLTQSCDIRFENVSFSYTPDAPVLKNISLTLKQSERIGIIGASGSGKSTFCDLLLGFVTPTSGQIFINGKDVSQMALSDLRNQIGYVGQKTFLFNDTVYKNVAYCQPQKSEVDVTSSCKAAHADEFIQKLPQKYQTNVGENGSKLSGGQKQRLTIARALLKNPPILIFDEATSALDNESENMIRLTLEENLNEKTVIVVSHRLSFIEKMNRIFLVQNHQMVEVPKKYLQDKLVQEEI